MFGNNSTANEFPEDSDQIIQGLWLTVYVVVYVFLTVVALVGNSCVILTICLNKRMRNNIFSLLLLLSISDLIFAAMTPFHVRSTVYPRWDLESLGDTGCKLYYFLFRGLYAFSILVLIVITVDRYMIIRYPLQQKTLPKVRYLSIILVLLSVAFASPLLYSVGLQEFPGGRKLCTQLYWPSFEPYCAYYTLLYLLLYVGPLLVMVGMYAKIWHILRNPLPTSNSKAKQEEVRRKKLANMMMSVVFAFFICWSPFTFLEAILLYKSPWVPSRDYIAAITYSMMAVYVSAAINPLLYSFFSAEFRKSAVRTLVHCQTDQVQRQTTARMLHRESMQSNSRVSRASPQTSLNYRERAHIVEDKYMDGTEVSKN